MATKSALLPLPRLEVQTVNNRHTTECTDCERVPARIRLHAKTGGGRWAKTKVYCSSCGVEYLQLLREQIERAERRLQGEQIAIRE